MNVYMQNLNNEKGISLMEALLSLFITLMILQALPFVLKSIWIYSQQTPQRDIPVYQFYHFIEQDLYTTTSIEPISNGIRLFKQNGDQIDIEQYGDILRRQVNQQGHQWLLQNVKTFQTQRTSKGFVILLKKEGGSHYQKSFNLYPQ